MCISPKDRPKITNKNKLGETSTPEVLKTEGDE
jgi:hypothetical protein